MLLIIGVNHRILTSLAPSTHWDFSISIVKLNVKMAPEMVGFFNWLPLFLNIIILNDYFSWLTNKAIEMKASMISARVKRLVQLKSTTPNAKDIPSIRREHRRRQKMLKKRKKTNQMLRQAKLTERFTLKMASKGIQESFIRLFIIIYVYQK